MTFSICWAARRARCPALVFLETISASTVLNGTELACGLSFFQPDFDHETRITTMKLESLRDLLIEQLRDLYDAEHQLTKALPKMAKAAASPELKAAFQKHLAETKGQIERLDQVFEVLGEKARKKACKAMQGLIAEGEETIKENAEPDVRDAALIAAAQRVEHYEMAGYGTVIAYAKLLKEEAVAKLLKATLSEEQATDEALTVLAESTINVEAA